MRKKFMVMITILMLGVGLMVVFDQLQPVTVNAVMEEKYEKVGRVGNYILYKDTSQKYFAQALERIYEDDENTYYFCCMKSSIYVLVNEEENIGVKEALANNKIRIEQLMRVLPEIIVQPNENSNQ